MNQLPVPAPISPAALTAFRAAAESITLDAVERALGYPDEVAQHGQDARHLLTQGLGFVTKGLDTALAFHTVNLLADQIHWAMDRLPHHGVEADHSLHRLHLYRDAVVAQLSVAYAVEVNAYIDWMIDYQRRLIAQAD